MGSTVPTAFYGHIPQGYHHGVIGKVNDDGSLYIKFDDGDAEWGLPIQNVIPSYPFTPPDPGITTSSRKAASSSSVDANARTESESSKGDYVDAPTIPIAEKDGTYLLHAPSPSLDQFALNNDNASKAGPSTESNRPTDNSDAHRQTVSTSENPTSEPPKPENIDLSWITPVANSVERSNLPVSGQPNSEGSDTGETKPVGNPYMPFSTGGLFTSVQGMPLAVHLTEGSTSVPITTPSLSVSGSTPSVADTTGPGSVPSIPQTRTPSHLMWAPSKHSTSGRWWGAPPPDDQETTHVEQLPSQRLLESESPEQAVALKSAHLILTTSHTAEEEDTRTKSSNAHKTGDDHVPISEDHRLSRNISSPGAVMSAGSVEPPKQDLTNETESGKSVPQEPNNERNCGSRDEEAVANHEEVIALSQGSAKSTPFVNGGSKPYHTQLTGEADRGRGGGSAAIPGNDLRAFVQRR